MRYSPLVVAVVFAAALLSSSCASTQRQMRSNALEYLYPAGSTPAPAGDVKLTLPVRVGIAFAPASGGWQESFTEDQKQQLLTRIANAFSERKFIASVQPIGSTYLRAGGGFADLDRIAASFGIDVVALVSYDQVQFSSSGKSSLAYWTIVGAYFVKGEKNETRTILDAAVFDVTSRAMLFNAPGQSGSESASTPIEVDRTLRERSAAGFVEATDNLIENLNAALDQFQEQAASGTLRGAGTPSVAFLDAQGQPVQPRSGDEGGGAIGAVELAAGALLLGAALLSRRSRGG